MNPTRADTNLLTNNKSQPNVRRQPKPDGIEQNCKFCYTSAPSPNRKPSLNLVLALRNTAALSNKKIILDTFAPYSSHHLVFSIYSKWIIRTCQIV